jgi:hypothetical protein
VCIYFISNPGKVGFPFLGEVGKGAKKGLPFTAAQ